MLEWDFGRIPKIGIYLKTNENILSKFEQYKLWQKAICRRPCTFHLAIFTEFLFLAYFVQGSVFFGTPCSISRRPKNVINGVILY